MQLKQIPVYKFSELSPEVREKMIREEQNFLSEFFDADYITDDWAEKLEAIGFENAKIYWSGFYSQGDGAFFEANCSAEGLLNTLIYCENRKSPRFGIDKNWRLLRALAYNEAFGIHVSITRTNNHYSHELSGHINIGFDIIKMSKKMYIEQGLLEELVNDLRINLCQQIFSDLEKAYEWETSEENAIESIESRDNEYLVNGDII